MNVSIFKNGYLIDVFDKSLDLNSIIKKFYYKYGVFDDDLVFDIYVCNNLKVFVIVTKNIDFDNNNSGCRFVYHFNSLFLFKINCLSLNNVVTKTGSFFYYNKCFYYYSDNFCDLDYIKILELCDEIVIGSEAIDIYNNGIRLPYKFLYSH